MYFEGVGLKKSVGKICMQSVVVFYRCYYYYCYCYYYCHDCYRYVDCCRYGDCCCIHHYKL